jgi:hypothetical protein
MAQERPNRLAEWLMLVRRQTPIVREHFAAWIEAVREEPRLAWETSAVRYTVYGLAALVLVWFATNLSGWIAPPPPSAKPAATTADFHVVCSDPNCGYHFVIHRKFGFDDFPVECPKCHHKTGVSARRCNSPTCDGRWVAPLQTDQGLKCPLCGAKLE